MRTDRGRQRFYAAGWVISAGVMVVASRVWRLHLREVEQRAEEAERTRDEVARRMAVEERLRIARELHDSLTHNISVICVQSGVAVHLVRPRCWRSRRRARTRRGNCARRSACCAVTKTATAVASATWTAWRHGRARP